MISEVCVAPDFDVTYHNLGSRLLRLGNRVDTGHWQSLKDVPHTKTLELQNVMISCGRSHIDSVLSTPHALPPTVEGLQHYFKPNLPWAEDHFLERVSGEPLNPGEEFRNWPWYRGGVESHKLSGQFSHTYMERFWPRWAGIEGAPEAFPEGVRPCGIRYRYGDLDDLIALLAREPYTRQAYLPVWFPEDLAAAAEHKERVPCSLGYHFMLRDGKLSIFYPMRSVDFLRYLRDDLYMAARLGLYVIESLYARSRDMEHDVWGGDITLGELVCFASSLHVFEGDLPGMRKEFGDG